MRNFLYHGGLESVRRVAEVEKLLEHIPWLPMPTQPEGQVVWKPKSWK